MHVAVVHNAVSEGAAPDVEDVLAQAAAVEAALARLGHSFARVACSLNLAELKARLVQERPNVAFNLVESLDGSERLQCLPVLLYEALGIPSTGAGSSAFRRSADKPAAKRRLRACGLPTPDWMALGDAGRLEPPIIIKAAWEHGSVGLSDESVLRHEVADVAALLQERSRADHRIYFAEQYIEGREFNLSLLASPDGPEVLPVAEIEFVGHATGSPRIVGYAAKWHEGSPEYAGTPRRFDFPESDGPLLDELRRLAQACWNVFELRGYARVDFRVDGEGRPWILEANANPCLSPDAGFAAALQRAGITYDDAIRRILDDALRS